MNTNFIILSRSQMASNLYGAVVNCHYLRESEFALGIVSDSVVASYLRKREYSAFVLSMRLLRWVLP